MVRDLYRCEDVSLDFQNACYTELFKIREKMKFREENPRIYRQMALKRQLDKEAEESRNREDTRIAEQQKEEINGRKIARIEAWIAAREAEEDGKAGEDDQTGEDDTKESKKGKSICYIYIYMYYTHISSI